MERTESIAGNRMTSHVNRRFVMRQPSGPDAGPILSAEFGAKPFSSPLILAHIEKIIIDYPRALILVDEGKYVKHEVIVTASPVFTTN